MNLALYRKYRPGRLSEVIGQDHVVEPLSRAISSDRVHHAYLFSGPRGCGKTSSARILARCLNCEQGPTPEPCGECRSCIDLAPNGPGSIDVIELDAATHGLVDDARDLREKAVYAPAASRYKIYIIDEAHQLGPGAANALLKLVEEPPEHLRFVFATTEPEKIIGTIRSRTHHYAFRLVPARTLQSHLATIAESEQVSADPAALALVARAAAGSVRDSLSILGQLLSGSGESGLTYQDAVAQLGFTDDALLDDFVQALATFDGPELFRIVDQTIETGHDPRRFATDVLERLRDLLVLRTFTDGSTELAAEELAVLVDSPLDRLDGLRTQAHSVNHDVLVRHADIVSRAISDLRGATSPKLQLELLVARLLIPRGDDPAALAARIAALESRVAAAPAASPAAPAVVAQSTPTEAPRSARPTIPRLSEVAPDSGPEAAAKSPAPTHPPAETTSTPAPSTPAPSVAQQGHAEDAEDSAAPVVAVPEMAATEPTTSEPKAASPPTEPSAVGQSAVGQSGLTLDQVQAVWPGVLEEVKSQSRVAWMLVMDSRPVSISDHTIVAEQPDPGAVRRYGQSGHPDRVAAAASSVLDRPVRVELVMATETAAGQGQSGRRGKRPEVPAVTGSGGPARQSADAAPSAQGHSSDGADSSETPAEPDRPDEPTVQLHDSVDDVVHDSVDADATAGIALMERELGAVTISEVDNSAGDKA